MLKEPNKGKIEHEVFITKEQQELDLENLY